MLYDAAGCVVISHKKVYIGVIKPKLVVTRDNLYKKNNGLKTNKLLNEKQNSVCVCERERERESLLLFLWSCAFMCEVVLFFFFFGIHAKGDHEMGSQDLALESLHTHTHTYTHTHTHTLRGLPFERSATHLGLLQQQMSNNNVVLYNY